MACAVFRVHAESHVACNLVPKKGHVKQSAKKKVRRKKETGVDFECLRRQVPRDRLVSDESLITAMAPQLAKGANSLESLRPRFCLVPFFRLGLFLFLFLDFESMFSFACV